MRFYDIDRDVIVTIEELRNDFEEYVKPDGEYETFFQYLSACMTVNGGTLETIVTDIIG